MRRVLLVDDEPAVLFAMKEVVRTAGHEPVLARSAQEALDRLEGVDAVVTDFAMPDLDGLALLQAIRERDASMPVILLTAQGSERVAVRAMKAGAYEYVTKPWDVDEITLVIERALETRGLRLRNRRLEAERAIGKGFVAESAAMRRLLDAVARVAPKDVTVLVRGETGTGKELVASLLHAQGRRAAGPLVRFNCAAIPAELAEAELFGHTRGAFTGATQARRGFFAEADGGTIVLDEVGELPASLQPKLLRVLQEGEIQPVGSGRVEKVDVRVVASTNRDLEADARAGRFREDLYYRLSVVELLVPPLRDHREDIPALVAEFARRDAERFGMEPVRLSPALVAKLRDADWPGNVRQLENAVARMVALGSGGELGPDAFDARPRRPSGALDQAEEPDVAVRDAAEGLSLREQLDALERSLIARMLAATGGNQTEAARRLGIGRTSLIDRMKRYGLT
ncbi:sigma-54-dependent transcriptional regulator [Anaeromyxobacter oryzisoli]|uniref:sigma-54-dependent transcriptional regulator n=1 Tax=Anaeromyxobacter oryzisoli TaxID=2925408 RepID=UPI001F57E52B|nr:sigma-54 dependent transcriptional regulator [Anaeromyxobacter sp. SG63]